MSTHPVQEPIANGNDVTQTVGIQITKLHDTVVALYYLAQSLEAEDNGGAAVLVNMVGEKVAMSVCELETLL